MSKINDDEVQCQECGNIFGQITWTHVAKHDLTLQKYKEKHGQNTLRPDDSAYKFNENKKQEFLNFVRDGATISAAAAAVNITRQAVHEYKNRTPGFAEEISIAKEEAVQEVEEALFLQAMSGHSTSMFFWLKNRAPDRWRDRVEQQVDMAVDDRRKEQEEIDEFIKIFDQEESDTKQ